MTDLITIQQFSDDDEPRVRDIELAERLRINPPRDIRRVIRNNLKYLNEFSCVQICAQRHPVNGSEIQEFWLTEGQAIYVVTKCQTPRASELTIAIVRGFQAWRAQQERRVSLPQSYPEALRALADEAEAHEATRERLSLVEAKAGARSDRMSAQAFTKRQGVRLARTQVGRLGKLANKHAQERGRRGEPVTDERYGSVLIHDVRDLQSAWDVLFGAPREAIAS